VKRYTLRLTIQIEDEVVARTEEEAKEKFLDWLVDNADLHARDHFLGAKMNDIKVIEVNPADKCKEIINCHYRLRYATEHGRCPFLSLDGYCTL